MEIEKNTDYWQNLKPPLSPNDYEIDLYKKHINTSTKKNIVLNRKISYDKTRTITRRMG